ncbi:tRNA (guanine-N(7)-)-methyltransferase non-catalytic subunit WDR4 [Hyla sarda]|uniref:tRNA (guanine-N(7)-)-methyltransferase non-catalytic subunit WDR4 n=1 Tax=Hyla sarda TaxID=327740 RepID=UPI0024C28B6B|nr:tRNA (guanine-N(7)-)-methyltransferase non-catalytic subunit WDR4 [Hyla sarda]
MHRAHSIHCRYSLRLNYLPNSSTLVPLTDRAKELSETVRENWERMKGSVTLENRFGALYKVMCDNMASYLQKKETRLQNEKRKLSTKHVGSVGKKHKT